VLKVDDVRHICVEKGRPVLRIALGIQKGSTEVDNINTGPTGGKLALVVRERLRRRPSHSPESLPVRTGFHDGPTGSR
jgi:hypothetical protein